MRIRFLVMGRTPYNDRHHINAYKISIVNSAYIFTHYGQKFIIDIVTDTSYKMDLSSSNIVRLFELVVVVFICGAGSGTTPCAAGTLYLAQ